MTKEQKKKIPQIAIVTGADPEELQDKINAALLEHPDLTDLDVYGHALPENDEKASGKLEEIFTKAQ